MLPLHAARTILVFRALMLGDWLCATPALRALRAGAPRAHIALCGLPWTAELARRLSAVDEFIGFPGHPALPERVPEAGALERFVDDMHRRRFDLALQMHGSGGVVNALVRRFAALATAGFSTPTTAQDLELAVPWAEHGTEIERCLALSDALGAPRDGMDIDLPLLAADREGIARLRAAHGVPQRYAIVHPGSQLPSRRWAPERFAAVADALAEAGLTVLLTGSVSETPLTGAVHALCRRRVIDLAGHTASIWALGALVEGATLVVANDTGISHIAAAVGTRSVIVACGSDVQRWAPLDRRRHRVHWHATPCRPCAHATCPTAHECAAGVSTAAVIATAFDLLESEEPCPTLPAACAS